MTSPVLRSISVVSGSARVFSLMDMSSVRGAWSAIFSEGDADIVDLKGRETGGMMKVDRNGFAHGICEVDFV